MRHVGIDSWIILLKMPSLEPSQKQPIKPTNSLINKLKVSQKEKNKVTSFSQSGRKIIISMVEICVEEDK